MNLDPRIAAIKTELEKTRDELNDILQDIRENLETLRSTLQDSPTEDKHPDKLNHKRG